ncbi:hypothetical protein RRG08_010744 [Elysia crispata]|uniref:Uncharacterized protein n=1 Tax=Elysia crispata TaxID=231223 RepID=A0AAE1AXN9_9GAST|nr:hypothetical protein RRG08_010744 [Elysia crispata]
MADRYMREVRGCRKCSTVFTKQPSITISKIRAIICLCACLVALGAVTATTYPECIRAAPMEPKCLTDNFIFDSGFFYCCADPKLKPGCRKYNYSGRMMECYCFTQEQYCKFFSCP